MWGRLTPLGCFTISIVSFILPPLLHMRILPNYSKGSWYLDLLFVILGVGVMALATFTTVLTIFHLSLCSTNTLFLLVGTVVAGVTALPTDKANHGVGAVLCEVAHLHATTALHRLVTVRHQMATDELSRKLPTLSFRNVCSTVALGSPSSDDPPCGNCDYGQKHLRKLPDDAMGSCRRGLLFSFVLTLGMRLLSGSRAECTYSRGRKSAVLRHVTDLSAVVTHHRPSLNRFTEFVPRARGNVLPRINHSGPFVVTVIDFPVHVSRNSSLGRTDRSNVTNTATTVANLVRWDEPTPKLVQRPRNCGQSFWRCPYWLQ